MFLGGKGAQPAFSPDGVMPSLDVCAAVQWGTKTTSIARRRNAVEDVGLEEHTINLISLLLIVEVVKQKPSSTVISKLV